MATKEPAVVMMLRSNRQKLLDREETYMRRMAKQWDQVDKALDSRFTDLAQYLTDNNITTRDRLLQLSNYQAALLQAQDETARYNRWAESYISGLKREAIEEALTEVPSVLEVALKDIGQSTVGLRFGAVNVGAVNTMIAMTAPATPLSALLSQAFPMAAENLTEELVKAIALGLNPKKLAQTMSTAYGVGLNRSLLIARTEVLRSYRESTRHGYEESGIVQGYQRVAFKSKMTCPACLMADGTVYPVKQYFIEHPQGRCVLIPVLETVGPWQYKTGKQWFQEQSANDQREILGEGRFNAWKSGAFELSDLIRIKDNSVWGKSLRTASLKELVGNKTFRSVPVKGLEPSPLESPSLSQSSAGYIVKGKNLDELEQLWYRLQDDTDLTPAEKADIAKQLRKAVRAKGGSITTFTGPKPPPPPTPVLETDWRTYSKMSLADLEEQYYLIKAGEGTISAEEREALLKRLRKTVREKGGSVSAWTGSPLPKGTVGTGSITVTAGPKPKLPKLSAAKVKELKIQSDVKILTEHSIEANRHLRGQTFLTNITEDDLRDFYSDLYSDWRHNGVYNWQDNPNRWLKFTDDFKFKHPKWSQASLGEVYDRSIFSYLTPDELANLRLPRSTGSTMKDLKKELKRLNINAKFEGILDSYFRTQQPNLMRAIEDLEDAVKKLDGRLPSRFMEIKFNVTIRSPNSIADANPHGVIRLLLNEGSWNGVDSFEGLVRAGWHSYPNTVLHEIWHQIHYGYLDTLERSLPSGSQARAYLRAWRPHYAIPSQYGQTNAFEYVAEGGNKMFYNKANWSALDWETYLSEVESFKGPSELMRLYLQRQGKL